jgi:glycosyltransferase involved in cell wall biosynthesis|tara:strand:+ start:431 stop:1060 length:630 start_codon:yes stop_codon:yes gene_type:complete
VDTNRFSGKQATGKLHQELGIPAPIRIIGNTSAISDEKDYDTFLDIAAHLTKSRSDIVFVIIGEGEKRAHIEERIQTENLAQSVFLTGYRTDIPDILPELDIFLMPSKTEGLGSSLIDAMACRVPIVSTYAGGIPELITHKSTGMLAPIGDAKALSEHITQILDDPGLDQRLTENAYAQLDRFNTETMAHKTEAVYRSILDLGSSSERV